MVPPSGIHFEIVDKISTTAYNNMAYALTRIEARVKGE